MLLHHVGYLVRDLELSIKELGLFGFQAESQIVYDKERMCQIIFLVKDGLRIELVCPDTASSPVYGLIKKFKNAPYHLCFEVDNRLEEAMEQLTDSGFFVFQAPAKAPAIENKRVSFLMSPNTGIFELLEKE